MIIELPWPPSVNAMWRSIGKGRVILSEKGRVYRKDVADAVLIQKAAKMLAGRLSVDVQAFEPDRRRRDLDNLPKGIFDGLTHAGVWLDDGQIDHMSITRREVVKGGKIVIAITEVID